MAVDLDRARTLAAQLVDALAVDPVSLPSPPVPSKPPVESSPSITSADAFDRALSLAAAGAVVTLEPGFLYTAPLTIRKPVTIQVAGALPLERIAIDRPLPRFGAGLTIASDHVALIGVDVRQTDLTKDLVVILGGFVALDRVRVLGDPVKGARRGIAANGNGNVSIIGSYVDDCFGPYPSPDNHDQQAICAWDMGPGLVIDNCFLRGGSETVMIGGADSSSPERMPAEITIRNNTITKHPEWQASPVSVKNVVEIKAGRKITITGNLIEQSWGGHGQDGYLLMLTVRNQDGRAPWSTIADVDITDNTCRAGSAAINILGRDNNHESGVLTRVRIRRNAFSDLDPQKYTGSAKLIQIDGGPDAVAITQNTFVGQHLTSALYLLGAAKATQLVVTENLWPKTKYGVFGDKSSVGPADETNPAWRTYVASGTLAGNREG